MAGRGVWEDVVSVLRVREAGDDCTLDGLNNDDTVVSIIIIPNLS